MEIVAIGALIISGCGVGLAYWVQIRKAQQRSCAKIQGELWSDSNHVCLTLTNKGEAAARDVDVHILKGRGNKVPEPGPYRLGEPQLPAQKISAGDSFTTKTVRTDAQWLLVRITWVDSIGEKAEEKTLARVPK